MIATDPNTDLFAIVKDLVARPARTIDAVFGGANSRSFRVDFENAEVLFLKLYPANPNDRRDRFGAEKRALEFLSSAGLQNSPKFIAGDSRRKAALLSWIDGSHVSRIGGPEIEAALNFVQFLHSRREMISARKIGPASESCPAPIDAIRQIEERVRRLNLDGPPHISALLTKRILPLLSHLSSQARSGLAAADVAFDAPLAVHKLTLSPSDFGFHNALRVKSGDIAWLDFEYFGWDDPVKLVADFVLHPAMNIEIECARLFSSKAAEIYADDRHFLTRLRYMMPLYDLRWCMIMLNAFDPKHHTRSFNDVERQQRLANVVSRIERLESIDGVHELYN